MAINFDHTNSSNITLKGPDGASLDNYNFIFPNTVNAEASLLISGEASIGSISGLQLQLDRKVNNSVTGSAALANTGILEGNVIVLGLDGKIPDQFIPSVAIRDIFEIATTGLLITLTQASIGDVAIVSDDHVNYILCSSGVNSYLDPTNWKELKFTQQTVLSVNNLHDDVVLNGANIYLNSGYYDGETIDYSIQDLFETKASSSSLTNYATTGYVTGCLNLYSTLTGVDSCLSGYVLTGTFTGIIADYSTTSQIESCLSTYYVPTGLTGSAAKATVGTDPGNVIALDGNSKIPVSLMPKISITDTFVIEQTGGAYGLQSLTLAEHGDVAIVTGVENLANFILTGYSYSDINDWQPLAASLGTVKKINNIDPINGNITLTSADIDVADSSTPFDGDAISYAVSGLSSWINYISGDYLTTSEASSILTDYVLTGDATGALNTKSDTGHNHEMVDISGLTGCLDSITTFYKGDGSYSVTQIGLNPLMNEAVGNYSVALGYGAKACQDYEIAHAGGIPTWGGGGNVGDAQASKIIEHCITNGTSLYEIGKICMQDGSFILFSVDIIGRTPGKYAAFKIEGSACRDGASSLLDNNSINTYINTNNAYYAEVVASADPGALKIKVSGDSQEMNWVTYSSVVKLK